MQQDAIETLRPHGVKIKSKLYLHLAHFFNTSLRFRASIEVETMVKYLIFSHIIHSMYAYLHTKFQVSTFINLGSRPYQSLEIEIGQFCCRTRYVVK